MTQVEVSERREGTQFGWDLSTKLISVQTKYLQRSECTNPKRNRAYQFIIAHLKVCEGSEGT